MRYTILLFFIFWVSLSHAQTQEDLTVFTAMGDEQARTKEQLVLPLMSKPFYVSYALSLSRQFLSKKHRRFGQDAQQVPVLYTLNNVLHAF